MTGWVTGGVYYNPAESMCWLRLDGCWLTPEGAVLGDWWTETGMRLVSEGAS